MDLTTLAAMPPWDWPTDTKDVLLGALRNEGADEADRCLAAELAGDLVVMDDEILDALLAVVSASDESETLRGKAAISLGPALEQADLEGFGDPDDLVISESAFRRAVQSLRKLYLDTALPADVRRCILEASVRAPQDWHADAIRTAFASDDPAWKLSAVFSTRWVGGFEDQILESLTSENEDIGYEAVHAAGRWTIDAAWRHVAGLITGGTASKDLLLAAIEAAANIRPDEAGAILVGLTEADDEDIVAAADEAMAGLPGDDEFEFDDEERT
ncbi:MAG TPA: hypothetical protein VNQ14_15010 [Woeseiaceae bacterium]|nr:hypothetical protein [Woeseiaceae bacterium]